jgi:hypothetical protein
LVRAAAPLAVMSLATGSSLYIIKFSEHRLTDADSYQMVFRPMVFFDGLAYYLSNLAYRTTAPALFSIVVFAVLLAIAAIFRRKAMLFAGTSFLFSLLPVIFIPAHRDTLYLYLPSVFASIFLIAAAREVAGLARLVRLPERFLPVSETLLCAAMAAGVLSAGLHERAMHVEFTKNLSTMNRGAAAFLRRLPVNEGATVVVSGAPDYTNVLAYNDGQGVQALCRIRDLKVLQESDPATKVPPGAIRVRYENGVYRRLPD